MFCTRCNGAIAIAVLQQSIVDNCHEDEADRDFTLSSLPTPVQCGLVKVAYMVETGTATTNMIICSLITARHVCAQCRNLVYGHETWSIYLQGSLHQGRYVGADGIWNSIHICNSARPYTVCPANQQPLGQAMPACCCGYVVLQSVTQQLGDS